MNDKKIVLIDGHSILHRAFYGIPDLTSPDGVHTNAVYGFLNIMFKILEEEQPGYLAVAFDLHGPTFRHKMYEAYKGTRKAMPDELREQVPLIKEMLTAMNIPLMMLEGYEADDLIGTVSLQMEKAGMEVSIISGDRDLLQLASGTTLVRIPKTKRSGTEIEDYYAKDVLEHYQVPPAGIIELKALMGDASDNIPGIPGVGEKTATKIIAEYGTIENAYAHLEEIKPNKARESLRDHYDMAQLSKTLATIDRNAPFELDPGQAELGPLYTEQALALCRKLGFKNMLSRFEKETLESSMPGLPEIETVTDPQKMAECFDIAAKEENAGIHLQGDDRLQGAALAAGGRVWYFSCGDSLGEQDLARQIENLAAGRRPGQSICCIGLKEQLCYLAPQRNGVWFDSAIASYLLNPLKNDYPYDEIAAEYAKASFPSRQELLGKTKPEDAPEDVRAKIAGYSALSALLSKDSLAAALDDTGMLHLFNEIEMPLVFTLFDMQKEGVRVRADLLRSFSEELKVRIDELEEQICAQAGEKFNINSPKQLGQILFEKLQMPYGKKTKTGYSTAADVLEKLSEEYPLVADILTYRQLTKLKSTYADGLSAFIAEDGRIHGKFHQMVTATGRISSADPNLQNIPVRTQLGRELRKVFVPKDGFVFVDADYSQIELRVLAHASGDPKLIEAYAQAKDIHAITASQVFHVPQEEVTPLLRRNAKAVNFGIVYGISSFGLSQGLSITRKEAQEYIEKYFETYPGIREFLDRCVSDAKEKGYAVTLFGRRRPVPELKSGNFMQRSFGERVAMNSPIQGTAADIIKIAMIAVHDRLLREGLRSRLIIQVHDELLIETARDEIAQVEKILKEEMTGAAKLKVALEIDMHTGESWYDAK